MPDEIGYGLCLAALLICGIYFVAVGITNRAMGKVVIVKEDSDDDTLDRYVRYRNIQHFCLIGANLLLFAIGLFIVVQ